MPLNSVNLLPEHFVERNRVRKLWRFWFRLLALVALLCAVCVSVARGVHEHTWKIALASQEASAPIRQVIDSNRQLQRRALQLSELTQQHSSLRGSNSSLAVLALLTEIRQSPDNPTQIISLELEDHPQTIANLPIADRIALAPAAPAALNNGWLRVTFIVRDGQRVTEVMRLLRRSNLFQQVALDGSIQQLADSQEMPSAMTFAVRCHL